MVAFVFCPASFLILLFLHCCPQLGLPKSALHSGTLQALLILHSCQLIPSPRTTISGTYWRSSIYHSLCWIFPQYGLSDLVKISPSGLWVPLGKVSRCQRNGILYISSSQRVVHIRWGSPETPWEVRAVSVITLRGFLPSALLTFALYRCKSMARKTAGSSAWMKAVAPNHLPRDGSLYHHILVTVLESQFQLIKI